MAAICIVIGTMLDYVEIMSVDSKEASGLFMQHYQIAILIQALGILLLFKALLGSRVVVAVGKLAPLTLGVYLIHLAFIEILQHHNICSALFMPEFSVPTLSIITFALSAIVVIIGTRIPILRGLFYMGYKNEK